MSALPSCFGLCKLHTILVWFHNEQINCALFQHHQFYIRIKLLRAERLCYHTPQHPFLGPTDLPKHLLTAIARHKIWEQMDLLPGQLQIPYIRSSQLQHKSTNKSYFNIIKTILQPALCSCLSAPIYCFAVTKAWETSLIQCKVRLGQLQPPEKMAVDGKVQVATVVCSATPDTLETACLSVATSERNWGTSGIGQ